MGTCLTEEAHTPELLELFRERTVMPRVALVRELLEAARERGELRAGADAEAAAVLLLGALQSQRLATGEFAGDWEERMVDAVLGGMLP